jgi:hypothetical protein
MLSVVLALAVTAASGTEAVPDQERFKAFFTQGEALYQQGEYGAAIWNFRQADRVRLTPEVAFDLAKCHEKLGDSAYTVYYYRLYLRRSPTASDALEVAERIGAVLATAEANGRGLLEVEATGARDAQIANQRYPDFPIAVFLPPGDYELSASFPSGLKKQQVSLKTGKTTTVAFEPLAPPMLSAGEAEDWARPGVEASAPGDGRRNAHYASYGLIGAGVVALAAGTAFGVMAANDLAASKNKNLPVSTARSLVTSANGKGATANILWIGGGVGAVAGGIMFALTLPEPGMKGAGSTP